MGIGIIALTQDIMEEPDTGFKNLTRAMDSRVLRCQNRMLVGYLGTSCRQAISSHISRQGTAEGGYWFRACNSHLALFCSLKQPNNISMCMITKEFLQVANFILVILILLFRCGI